MEPGEGVCFAGKTSMTRPTTPAISPFWIVSNVDRTIAFYRDKLGFEKTFQKPARNPDPQCQDWES
jgi:hypothetical protein